MAEMMGWTRRAALAALGATAAATAAGAPAFARVPRAGPTEAAGLAPLRALALAATATPPPARLGAAYAEGQSLPALEAALRRVPALEAALAARLGPVADEAACRAALVAAGRADLEAGVMVEIAGIPVMRIEAEFLALGVLLRRAAVG